jgi:hypothetical protein
MMGPLRLRFALAVGCVLPFLWTALFPAISVSTGELKPRGVFVDENALSVSSLIQTRRENIPMLNANCTNWNCVCSSMSVAAVICRPKVGLIEIHFTSVRKMQSEEATVIVFPIETGAVAFSWSLDFIYSFLAAIDHRISTSKNVIVLIVPTAARDRLERFSPILQDWLSRYHNQSHDAHQSARFIVREALVIDLLGSSRYELDAVEQWSGGMTLLTTGSNGVLPNMDLTSLIKTLYSKPLRVSTAAANPFTANWRGEMDSYGRRLWDMLLYIIDLALGPSFFHAQFLERNIDSLTIAPGNPQLHGKGGVTPSDLIGLLLLILRATHSLHGSLMQIV